MKIKNNKLVWNSKIVVISLCVLVLIIISSISYAYFTATVIGNDTAKGVNVNTGTMALVLNGTTIVSPNEAMLPGATHTINFTVTNPGTIATPYGIDLINVTNNFADKNDLVYSITSTNSGGAKTTTVMPSEDTTLIPAIIIEPGITQEYTMTIHFKETADNQNDNQGKTFGGLIQINNLENSNYLASKVVISNPIITSVYEEDSTLIQSGLIAVEDDQGTSYVNRDRVYNKNNLASAYTNELSGTYVSFANILWRIVRVNGDGSIRIITDEKMGESLFNTTYQGHQYVGYTYNNSHNCTNSNPCNGSEGTSSTIKTYLDNWINTNLSSYEDKIVIDDYCNDTSYRLSESTRYYGAYDRLVYKHNQTLKCPNTSVNYGGKYNLKIGLLSADEIALAGIERDTIQVGSRNNYLYKGYWWWSLSPISSSTSYAYVFDANYYSLSNSTNRSGEVRPVISLRADIIITGGDGSKSNPYVV